MFDPLDTARWGKVLDPDGDGVYNFTTITVNSGTTLQIQGDKVNRPVYWRASGAVLIAGVLDLSGASGGGSGDLSIRRQVAIPGAGGYAGGAGGNLSPLLVPTAGEGPGGGSGGSNCINANIVCGHGGTFTGNHYLFPLVGGSGGEGANTSYASGGAGGGAILIASSTSIAVTGSILARGGQGAAVFNGFGDTNHQIGGGGSGGAIRLVAPVVKWH